MQWYKHPAYPVSATPTGFLHATPCQQKAYESLPLVPKSPKDGCNATRRRGTVGPHKKRYGQPIRKIIQIEVIPGFLRHQMFCLLADRYSWYSDISENDCSIKELFGMMHKNNEKIAFYLISLLLSLYYVYFADTNTFHYFTIKIITR